MQGNANDPVNEQSTHIRKDLGSCWRSYDCSSWLQCRHIRSSLIGNLVRNRHHYRHLPTLQQTCHRTNLLTNTSLHHHAHKQVTTPPYSQTSHHTNLLTNTSPHHHAHKHVTTPPCSQTRHHTTMLTNTSPHHHAHKHVTTPPCSQTRHHTTMLTNTSPPCSQICHHTILHHIAKIKRLTRPHDARHTATHTSMTDNNNGKTLTLPLPAPTTATATTTVSCKKNSDTRHNPTIPRSRSLSNDKHSNHQASTQHT